MKSLKILALALVVSPALHAQAVFTSADIDYVFAGYPDHSIGFKPIGEAENPANCDQTGAYAMLPSYDTQGALSVLLAAKAANKEVYFSIRDDICHSFPQTDNPGSFPVIQRIAIR
ncbi:hypothetical protein MED121_04293 [Marinomonas sp. MED121]|uniref:hypothetical protein n=1 Tax=Marinomonas sp. MED121 TaxID=314277 RepID=UPI000068FAB1|nr:hypothetical protein [Marinomonas sp. MED121]EAQ63962.1 hypothetical protein MED121_04293 [Marinomonas sp. MED121]